MARYIQEQLIELMAANPNRTARWYADEIMLNIVSVRGTLRNLENKGLVERDLEHPKMSHNRGHNQFIWRLTVRVA